MKLLSHFLGGYLVSKFIFPDLSAFHSTHLFVGVASSATSIGIITNVLSSKKKMSTPEGVTTLAAAIFDDVISIILFAIVLGVSELHNTNDASSSISAVKIIIITIKAIALWAGSTIIGIVCSRKISYWIKKTTKNTIHMALFVFGMTLIIGGVFEILGLSIIVGAYIVGLTISNTDLSYVIQEKLFPISKFFIPIFFIVSGMKVNIPEFLNPSVLFLGILLSFAAIITKFIGSAIPSFFLGFNSLGSTRIGIGMVSRGEVSLIVGSFALSAGFITSSLYSAIMFMIISSAFVTSIVAQTLYTSQKMGTKKTIKSEDHSVEVDIEDPKLTRFIVDDFLLLMEEESFFINKIRSKEKNIYHIRKNAMFITMHVHSKGKIVFLSDIQSVPFFQTALYEAAMNITASAHILEKKIKIFNEKTIKKQEVSLPLVSSPEKIDIKSVLSPFLILLQIKSKTKKEVIEELINLIDKGGFLHDKQVFLNDILERENTFSTGLEKGVAFPHAKSIACKEPKIVIGIKKEGIDFDSMDKQPSNIFILFAIPKDFAYLGILSQVTKFLNDAIFREKLLACTSETSVVDLFCSYS